MSTREMIINVIDQIPESQLKNVLAMLENVKAMVDEAEDEAYCKKLYDEYRNSSDDEKTTIGLTEFAETLGVILE